MKTEKNILIAFLLNIIFSMLEFVGGIIIGSIAIISDSIHDITDAISIGIAYFLEKKSKQKADKKHTYGYYKYSIIGSVITTFLLLLGSIFVIYESVKRIINPVSINYDGMIIFAIFGVIINFIAKCVTQDGDSLNQKSVSLHMLEDVLGWFVVLLGSIFMKFTNISLIDPILSIGVAVFILISALKNLKIIIDIFLETTPKNINIDSIRNDILKIGGVFDVHHIHIRSIDGYKNTATMHIVIDKYSEKYKKEVRKVLEKYSVYHSTVELELKSEICDDKSCNITKAKIHHHG